MSINRRTFLRAVSAYACSLACPMAGAATSGSSRTWQASNKALGRDALGVVASEDGNYEITVLGTRWFMSGPTAVHCGRWYSNAKASSLEGELKKINTVSAHGTDALGDYEEHHTRWQAGDTLFETSFRVYENLPCIVFAQSFPEGAGNFASMPLITTDPNKDTGAINDEINRCGISSVFPAFKLAHMPELGNLYYSGCFASPQVGRGLDKFPGGTEAGTPLILFDSKLTTVVLSPLNHFLNAVQIKTEPFDDCLTCGLSGQIASLPKGFQQEFIMFAGQGINQTMFEWGSALLKISGKDRRGLERDMTACHLGYWTNNGAYHYYNPEPGKNLEETIVDVASDLRARAIPVGYMELDSWWYNKGSGQEPLAWEPRPDVIPHGLGWLHDKINMPLALHNRYWTKSNSYQSKYPFLVGEGAALPASQAFWDDTLGWAHNNGAVLYEQDWLNKQFDRLFQLRTDAELGDKWLKQMSDAADAHSMSIMYCMPLPSFYLASTGCPSVTQIRASTDYAPGSDQWRIGKTSILAWALGLAPFKDVFWSTGEQEGNTYNRSEPNSELQALVSTLSCGAVGPGDKIGLANRDLLLKTCRADGLLLKPDKPATTIDKCFLPDGPSGEVWSTYVELGGSKWYYLLVADQNEPHDLSLGDLGLDGSLPYIVLDCRTGSTILTTTNTATSSGTALRVGGVQASKPGTVSFQYFLLVPFKGLTFLGETGKFVRISKQRCTRISKDNGTVDVTGATGESMTLEWHCPDMPDRINIDGQPALLNGTSVRELLTSMTHDPKRARLSIGLTIPHSGKTSVEIVHSKNSAM